MTQLSIFCYNIFMQLVGKKIILKPHRLKDAALYARWFSDPIVTQYTGMHGRRLTIAQERIWIRNHQRDKHEHAFAVWTKRGTKPIGTIALHVKPDAEVALVEFGIIMGDRAVWGKGYAADAMRAILGYGFQKFGLHRVQLRCFPANTRAKRLYKHVGFKREGLLREEHKRADGYHDVEIWSMLVWEWGTRE